MGITKIGWIKRKLNGNGIPWNKGTRGVMKKNSGSFKKGMKLSLETRKKLSRALIGRKGTMNGKKISQEHKDAISRANTGKVMPIRFGKNAPNWQGGKTNENSIIRNSKKSKLWREAVFQRDEWTCQECGKIGWKLNAHHIKSFSKYPELRFAIDNGITLCVECHKKTDTFLKHLKHDKS